MKPDPGLQRQISASLLRVCAHSSFFATLALHARIEASAEIPTAATDGKAIFVNPEFWGGLKPAEQDGLLLHEVLHAALLHVPRRGGREPKLWNYAADIVINGMILREGFSLPEGGLRDVTREHLSTEEVYELLMREAEKIPVEMMAVDLLEGAPDDAEGKPGSPAPGNQSAPGQEAKKLAGERQWQNALEQARVVAKASVSGRMPAGVERELANVSSTRLDWRAYLWRYLTQTPTDFAGFDRRTTLAGIEAVARHARRILPALANVNVIRTFSGLRPYTPTGLPFLGPVAELPGLVMAAGHEGDGIALAPVTGKKVAEYLK